MHGATMMMIHVSLRLPTLVTRDSVRDVTSTTENKLHE